LQKKNLIYNQADCCFCFFPHYAETGHGHQTISRNRPQEGRQIRSHQEEWQQSEVQAPML